ncbi:MAG: CotH kinase family protein [Prevotella sp.]|nr:CotH kinase family protein [Prevotella sp.]
MKKLFFPILIAFCLTACTKDLTDFYIRLDQREAANKELQKQNEELRKQNEAQEKWNAALAEMNARLQLEADELEKKLDSLEAVLAIVPIVEPKLRMIEFVTDENPMLTENLTCEIIGDSVIECWLPMITTEKYLIPRFTFDGTLVTIDGMEAQSGASMFDFKAPVTVTVHTSEKSVSYTMYVHSYTGLPIMRIDTEGGAAITSKEVYINAHMTLTEDIRTRDAGDLLEADLQIKGRGNSTWVRWPKKPYRLKFIDKVSLFGEHKDRSWVLIANYADKSAIRNHTALYMGKISNLNYTPSSHFVDLILNGQYNGTYEVCEKIKISNHRVAVGDDGFLLEVDNRVQFEGGEDARFFFTNHMTAPISIEDPEVEIDDENFEYVRNFVSTADDVLYSDLFLDPAMGWKNYFDMDSFVDWYLINEITHNPDATMMYSCYMHLKRGGKITMGPVWDFDLAFGNTDYWERGPYNFWIKKSDWIIRMFKDPEFVARVKERYDYFYSRKNDIFREMDETATYLKRSAQENEDRWHTLYHYALPNYEIWGSYYNEVQSVKEWLNTRMDWLKTEFDKM